MIEKLSSALDSLQDLQRQNKELKDLIEAERAEHAEGLKEERLTRTRQVIDLTKHTLVIFRLLAQIKDLATGKPSIKEEKLTEVEEVTSKNAEITGLYSKDHEVARRKLDSGVWEVIFAENIA